MAREQVMRGEWAGGHTVDTSRPVRIWLYAVAALVFAMIVVGGATRLTDSGLSITEWQPILGAIPPLSDAAWHEVFEKYRQIPEYKLVNKGMSLDAFKFIFWWEWGHRFLGRLIGLAFAVPFAIFLVRGKISAGMGWKLAGLFLLGGLQGGIGWYMVQSGLVDRIDVSQYRLALHLTVAFLIFALLLWTAFSLRPEPGVPSLTMASRGQIWTAGLLLALVMLQVVLGAFVAGLKAGLSHNTWPLMNGYFIPPGLLAMKPWYLNFFENVMTVQFNHRMVAYVICLLAIWHAVRTMPGADDPSVRRSAGWLAVAILAQAGFGIWTLLAHVPLWLGLVHQGMAAVVLMIATWHLFAITRRS